LDIEVGDVGMRTGVSDGMAGDDVCVDLGTWR
jgi:hypothetical protein